jgi:hypothetical protein
MIERSSANAAFGSPRTTLHLPPPPPPPQLSPLLLLDDEPPQSPPPQPDEPPDDDDDELSLQLPQPDEPPEDDDDELSLQLLHPEDPPDDDELLLLLQPLLQPPPPLLLLDDESPPHPPPPPPPPPPSLDESHESQLPPQPFWLFELAHVLSHDSELPQLGPEQLQFGEAWQFALLSLQPSPQLMFVERGGSPLLVPASGPGPG